MRLPPPSQTPSLPHLTLAQEAASCGATQRALLHVDRALIDGMVEDFGMDGTLEWYHKILKLGRRAGGPGATQLIIDHMIQAEITPDAVAAHLAAATPRTVARSSTASTCSRRAARPGRSSAPALSTR